jgi:hypothetical protein
LPPRAQQLHDPCGERTGIQHGKVGETSSKEEAKARASAADCPGAVRDAWRNSWLRRLHGIRRVWRQASSACTLNLVPHAAQEVDASDDVTPAEANVAEQVPHSTGRKGPRTRAPDGAPAAAAAPAGAAHADGGRGRRRAAGGGGTTSAGAAAAAAGCGDAGAAEPAPHVGRGGGHLGRFTADSDGYMEAVVKVCVYVCVVDET